MNRRIHCILQRALLCIIISLIGIDAIGAITFKLASTVPEATLYGDTLNRIAERWREATDGAVTIRVFHGGVAGPEEDVLRKMRINQIHMGIFSSLTLSQISDKVLTVSMPGMIRSTDELFKIFDAIEPKLSEDVNAGPFEVLGWARPGWIYFFSNQPVATPDDLRETRLALSNNEGLLLILRKMKMNVQDIDLTNWLTGLNSGLIDSILADPLAVAGLQLFTQAPYMLNLPVAPYLANFLITDRAWRRVPQQYRAELRSIVVEEIRNLEQESIATLETILDFMQQYGLEIIQPSPAVVQEWNDFFELGNRESIGTVFNEDMYNLLTIELAKHR